MSLEVDYVKHTSLTATVEDVLFGKREYRVSLRFTNNRVYGGWGDRGALAKLARRAASDLWSRGLVRDGELLIPIENYGREDFTDPDDDANEHYRRLNKKELEFLEEKLVSFTEELTEKYGALP